jgi:hypothetical protein
VGGVAEKWGPGSATGRNFSEMPAQQHGSEGLNVCPAVPAKGDCGYRRLFEQVYLLTSLVRLPLRRHDGQDHKSHEATLRTGGDEVLSRPLILTIHTRSSGSEYDVTCQRAHWIERTRTSLCTSGNPRRSGPIGFQAQSGRFAAGRSSRLPTRRLPSTRHQTTKARWASPIA